MPQTRVRVVGSGFTVLLWRGKRIAWLDSVRDSGQAPYGGQGWEPIYTLGSKRPREIATTRVISAGTLTASIRELWEREVWDDLTVGDKSGEMFRGANDIVDVWQIFAEMKEPVTCSMVIKDPANPKQMLRQRNYHNCLITGIDTSEAITVGALSVTKDISITYTHVTREQRKSNDTSVGGGNNN